MTPPAVRPSASPEQGGERVYPLTAAQILAVYEAGIERGGAAQCAYEWGSTPPGDRLDDLQDVMRWGYGADAAILPGDADERAAAWEQFKLDTHPAQPTAGDAERSE